MAVLAAAAVSLVAVAVVLVGGDDDDADDLAAEAVAAAVRDDDGDEVADLVEVAPDLLDGAGDLALGEEHAIPIDDVGYGLATVDLEEDVEYTVHRPSGVGMVVLDDDRDAVEIDRSFVAASDGEHAFFVGDGRTSGSVVVVVTEVESVPLVLGEEHSFDLPRAAAVELTFEAEAGLDYSVRVLGGDGYVATVLDEGGEEAASNARSDPDFTDFEVDEDGLLTVRLENANLDATDTVTVQVVELAAWFVFAGHEADPFFIEAEQLREFDPGLDPDRQVLTWCFFVGAEVYVGFTIDSHNPASDWTLIEYGSEAARETSDELARFRDPVELEIEPVDEDRTLCYDLDLNNGEAGFVTVEVTDRP